VEVAREHSGGKGVEYLVEASGAGQVVASIPVEYASRQPFSFTDMVTPEPT